MNPAKRPTFAGIFEARAAYVGRTLRYLGVSACDLEDAAQEVFVVVHKKLHQFRPGTSLNAWLYAICLHTAQTYRRRAARRREVLDSDTTARPAEPERSTAPDADRLEARTLALRLLSELEETKREVFVLYELEQLTMQEITELIGVPLQTGYSRLRAAREQLAREVKLLGEKGTP